MKIKGRLYLTIDELILASGIDESIIKKDIKNGKIQTLDGEIWYRNAAQYVFEKWAEGKIDMYSPFSDDVDNSFAMRLLSILDDEIAARKISK